jgi:hypothetical protein
VGTRGDEPNSRQPGKVGQILRGKGENEMNKTDTIRSYFSPVDMATIINMYAGLYSELSNASFAIECIDWLKALGIEEEKV